MRALLNDLRYSARSLVRRPGASVVAVLSLGIGIGVTTTAFSLLNALALRDLPGVVDQERLVTLGLTVEAEDGGRVPWYVLSWRDVEVLREQEALFSDAAGAGWAPVALSAGGEPVVEEAEVVTPSYFRVLGGRPHLGRWLDERDAEPGVATAVLSYRVYEGLGRPADVLERGIELNGHRFQVVGVAPPHFTGMIPGDAVDAARPGPGVWVSLAEGGWIRPRGVAGDVKSEDARWLHVVARLADGVSRKRLVAGLPGAGAAVERAMPESRPGARLLHGDLHFGPGSGAWRPVATVAGFLVVPLLVLLIACANAANLLLARATERRRELAVRAALGADRRDLVRQLLSESVLLALAAGVLGLLVAQWSRAIAGLYAVRLSMTAPVDLRVFGFTFVVAVAAGLGLGLVPALGASRPEVRGALSGAGRTTSGRGDRRLRRGLVVTQVALSLLLLVVAGLFVRSAEHGTRIPSGLREDGLVLVTLDPGILQYDDVAGRAFYEELLAGVRGLPDVRAAALAELPPLQGLPRGRVAPAAADVEHGASAGVARVGDGFFTAAGIDLMAGRPPRPGASGAAEVVVSRTLAESLWPEGDPLGQSLRVRGDAAPLTVVAVASDARSDLHAAPEPVIYRSLADTYTGRATVYLRTDRPDRAVPAVRDVVRRLDRRLPLHEVETARQLRARALLPWRLLANGLGTLGGIALFLAVAGLYGVMSFSVARRTREIGVRMAMGAGRRGVVAMVLRESLALVGAGVAVGGVLALSAALLLRSLLFGVSPVDPTTWGTLVAVLLGVGALAAAVPARRAASIEPVNALKD